MILYLRRCRRGDQKQPVRPSVPRLSRSSLWGSSDRRGSDLASWSTSAFGLKQVRRALANIPTYMIFDDHEVTDDWNMTREFCNEVYGTELGLRIVQNATGAYALCQHWGNARTVRASDDRRGGGCWTCLICHSPGRPAFRRCSRRLRLPGTKTGIRRPPAHPDGARQGHPQGPVGQGAVPRRGCARLPLRSRAPTARDHLHRHADLARLPQRRRRNLRPAAPVRPNDQVLGTPLGNRALLVVLSTNAPPMPGHPRRGTPRRPGAQVRAFPRRL